MIYCYINKENILNKLSKLKFNPESKTVIFNYCGSDETTNKEEFEHIDEEFIYVFEVENFDKEDCIGFYGNSLEEALTELHLFALDFGIKKYKVDADEYSVEVDE